MTMPRVFTVEQVAELFHVHTKTIYRALEAGALKGFKVGTQWRVSEENLRAYMGAEPVQGSPATPEQASRFNDAPTERFPADEGA